MVSFAFWEVKKEAGVEKINNYFYCKSGSKEVDIIGLRGVIFNLSRVV